MPAYVRRFVGALFAFALLCACASRDVSPSLPGAAQSVQRATNSVASRASVPLASTDVVAVDAGGPATGGFAADQYYSPVGTYSSNHANTISTAGIANPAPQAVYQTERVGSTIAYTIPNLTSGDAYTVKLSFAETFFTSAGKRVFNIAIGGTTVLSNFDIFAAAGANNAVVESFPATASAGGTITIVLTAVTNNAVVSAIEIATTGSTPAPTPTPTPTPTGPVTSVVDIDSGGAAAGAFVADTDFTANGSYGSSTTSAIDTSAVSAPAPQAVYQTMRVGKSVIYTIPGLHAGATYGVRLDFAETYFSSSGKRVFDVNVNGTPVLTNFDVYQAAGAKDKAIAKSFSTVATSAGSIVISLAAVANNAAINGIEITTGTGGPAPSPSPTPAQSVAFNDYTTFGYDNQRDVFNPNSTALTSASLPNVHLAWQVAIGGGDFDTQTQPVLATEIPNHAGVLFVGGGSGNIEGYDALTGTLLWKRSTGQELFTCENDDTIVFGVQGSAAYDPASKSLYIVGNANSSPNAIATNTLYHLDGATGSILGQVNIAPPASGWPSLDFSHTSVTLANGYAYVGTGATCDISSWRGRVAAVSVPAMTLAHTFYPAWNPSAGQPWGGGGVWGWGGVSIDFSGNVMSGAGNTDDGSTTHGSIVAPFQKAPTEYSAYGDSIFQLSPDLSTVEASNHPMPASVFHGDAVDLDLNGTPVVFKPNGALCDSMAAIQGKSGTLYVYDTTHVGNGPLAQYQLAPSTYADGFLGDPAYSPVTGLLYAAVPSSNESLYAPGMIAINPGCDSPSVAWHSAFGPDSYAPGSLTSPGEPRSAPAVSAGGIVLVGTICKASASTCGATTNAKPLICCAPPGTNGGALWALDATTGTVLNGGNPIIITGGALRMPPTIDGDWIFVLDNSGNLYALTIDPSYPAIQTKNRAPNPHQVTTWGVR